MDRIGREKLQKKIDQLVKFSSLAKKKVVLFGASAMSKEVNKCLLAHGIRAKIIVDNDVRKKNTRCMGINVQTPEEALMPINENFLILIYSVPFYKEILNQLYKMGYKKNKHIAVLNYRNDDSLMAAFNNISKILLGKHLYKNLLKNMPGDTRVFIAPYTGTGDIYLVGLFFWGYLKKNKLENYLFVTVSGACRAVAQMFNIENIVVIKQQNANYIIDFARFSEEDIPITVLNDGWGWDALQWIRGYKNLSFDEMFRHFVFENDIQYNLPPNKNSGGDIDHIFEESGLIKGKTVVLSPYSNTLLELPDSFWEPIVQKCSDMGYSVCTNCAADIEKPIKGTKPIFFPLGQAIEFMDSAGYFIGVRSGLCDVISSSSCIKVVLYQKDEFFYKSSPFEYFSLKKMGLCNDAVELEYSMDKQGEILNKVLSLI